MCHGGRKDKTISEDEEEERGDRAERVRAWRGGGRNEMENCSSFSEKPFERAFLAASSSFASMI